MIICKECGRRFDYQGLYGNKVEVCDECSAKFVEFFKEWLKRGIEEINKSLLHDSQGL